jgi:hypothetical protein
MIAALSAAFVSLCLVSCSTTTPTPFVVAWSTDTNTWHKLQLQDVCLSVPAETLEYAQEYTNFVYCFPLDGHIDKYYFGVVPHNQIQVLLLPVRDRTPEQRIEDFLSRHRTKDYIGGVYEPSSGTGLGIRFFQPTNYLLPPDQTGLDLSASTVMFSGIGYFRTLPGKFDACISLEKHHKEIPVNQITEDMVFDETDRTLIQNILNSIESGGENGGHAPVPARP